MPHIVTMEIAYNIRIFIQLSAKRKNMNRTFFDKKLEHKMNKYLKDI